MKVVLLTREYPPEVYGGAGVHADHLARELSRLVEVEVRCYGQPRAPGPPGSPSVVAYQSPGGAGPLQVLATNVAMAEGLGGAAVLHSHTWYANLAGHLGKLLHGVPHVVTSHSLEPLRPWKAEQIGAGGYAVSCLCERLGLEGADAVIAVSEGSRRDILRCYPSIDPGRVVVVHNGVDAEVFRPDPGTAALERLGIDPSRPSVVFVGRITRQKGLTHLLDAAEHLDPRAQLVLCAGAPDTEQIGREVAARVEALRLRRSGVVWVQAMLPRADLVQVLSHATAFCCPSVYEPLGIVNLEAAACEAPVVATTTGGIPEVVQDGVNGLLVPFEPGEQAGPRDPRRFALDLADRLNALVADPARAREMGKAGRRLVVERFAWPEVARRTVEIYQRLAAPSG